MRRQKFVLEPSPRPIPASLVVMNLSIVFIGATNTPCSWVGNLSQASYCTCRPSLHRTLNGLDVICIRGKATHLDTFFSVRRVEKRCWGCDRRCTDITCDAESLESNSEDGDRVSRHRSNQKRAGAPLGSSANLIFEYFESAAPYIRSPLADKVRLPCPSPLPESKNIVSRRKAAPGPLFLGI